jgi:hypothetical protein
LTDTQSGDAADFSQCAALVGTTLPPGDSTSCQYTVTHTQAGTYNNTAAPEVTDDEGTSANDSADESVEVTNVLPDISVVKTANPANLVFPGGVVTFEIVVTNNSNPADTVTITSMLDDVYGNLFDTSDAKPQLTAVSCDIYSIPPGTSATCTFDVNFSLSIGDEIFLTETDEVTVTAVDEEGSSDFDSDDAIVTITPPIFFTNSSLCTFDTRDDIEDRQWRRILTQDVQQWPDFKFGATNPGQFFYNLSISGESCDEPDPADCPTQIAELTLEFSWPFVTQGSKALHAWHGVDIYYVQDDLGNEQICYCPGYNSVNESGECEPADPVASCDFEITLADYSAVIDSRSGYTEHGDGSWTADTWSFPVATYAPGCVLELPDDGFLYVNQHLDDGLKGPDIDVDAIIPGLTPDDGVDDRYSKYLQEHAVDPATLADTDPAVLMPELAIHTFTMTATVDGDIQTGSDSVQNDNEFKKNPGVAGRVTLGTTASGDAVDVGDEVEIHLTDPEGNPVGSCDGKVDRRGNDNGSACFGFDWTDSDGWWQIIYKHKGKPAMYTIDVVFPASYDNCYADDTDWSCGSTGSDWVCTKQERLKGNAFSEVNLELFLGDMITACDPTL